MRAARVEVDLGAVAHNVGVLRTLVAPSLVCAVVKADGYGHGAIAVSEAALDAGADWLAVALIEEAAVLRSFYFLNRVSPISRQSCVTTFACVLPLRSLRSYSQMPLANRAKLSQFI